MAAEDADRPESLVAEEQLAVQVPLTAFEHDLVATLLRELVDETQNHLLTDSVATDFGGDGKVQNLQPRLVQFVDHEADDLVIVLRDHPNAVPLAEAAEEVFIRPGKLKAGRFDAKDFLHIAANQPANLDVELCMLFTRGTHVGLPAACVRSNRSMSLSACRLRLRLTCER